MNIPELIELVKTDHAEMVALFKDVAVKGIPIESDIGVRKVLVFDGHRFEILICGEYWTAFIDGKELTYTTEPL